MASSSNAVDILNSVEAPWVKLIELEKNKKYYLTGKY